MSVNQSRFPLPETILFFENHVSDHNRVNRLERISDYYYKIRRYGMPDVKVLVTNYYVLGQDELDDLLSEYPDADCIITMSGWNRYTSQAYNYGQRHCVGVFKFGEFLGALNNERPYQYTRPVDREDN